MKIKLNTEFKALGKVLLDRIDGKDVAHTMKRILLSHYIRDEKDPIKRLEAGQMAEKVNSAKKHIDLTMEQFVEFRKWVKDNITNSLLYTAIESVLDTYESN